MKKYLTVKSVGWVGVFSVILFSSIFVSAQTKAPANWIGTYTFTDSASPAKRRNSRDVVSVVEYILTVTEKANNRLSATLEVNGMQTFEIYECLVENADGKLHFYFLSGGIPDGGTDNPRDFKKGALLFSLTKTTGVKTKYQFQPAAFQPVRLSSRMKNLPIYFHRNK